RAIANRADVTFICVIGSELVQKYVDKGTQIVCELFEMACSKKNLQGCLRAGFLGCGEQSGQGRHQVL
ncbi:hypothetical protein B0H19DRAFT_945277, partial [Mycena capillaripes]